MVEWKKLGEICEIGTGANNREDACDDGLYPFFVRSQEVLRINEYLFNEEAILIPGEGGIGDIFHYFNGKYGLHQRTYRVHPISDSVYGKYIYYYLFANFKCYINKKSYKSTAASIRKPMLTDFPISIPSLSEQQRIVSILDTFTSSISNLKQQIEERRKQYEYERDLLLDLEGKEGVEMKKLGDFAEIGTGSSNTQDELESGRYPFFVRSQIVKWKDDYEFDEIAIITSGDGVGVGKVLHYYEGKYALHQRAYRIHVENDSIVPKFIFYFMQKDFYWYIMSNAYAASVTSVRRPMLINYPIPIPPLSTQSRIVSILDTFEQSISNLEEQLAMREKQYEYYRNQLLTFEGEEERGKT